MQHQAFVMQRIRKWDCELDTNPCQRDYNELEPSYFPRPPKAFWGEGIGPLAARRWSMTPLTWLLIVWGVLTAILVVLLIYRSTLSMHEDDQLFLSNPDSPMHTEQTELLAKMNKISPMLKIFGTASGAMILVIGVVFVYQSLSAVQ